jgi:hypothetical protein
MDKGFKGAIADSKHVDADSKVLEVGSAAEIEFGSPVKQGTADENCKHLDSDGDKIQGIFKHRHVEDGLIYDGMVNSIIRKGRVFVEVSETVAIGDKAYYVRATKNYSKTAGAGSNEVVSGEFKSSALVGEIAILEINLSQN